MTHEYSIARLSRELKEIREFLEQLDKRIVELENKNIVFGPKKVTNTPNLDFIHKALNDRSSI